MCVRTTIAYLLLIAQLGFLFFKDIMLLYVRQLTTAMTALVITIRYRHINFYGTTIQCSECKRMINKQCSMIRPLIDTANVFS